MASPQLHGMRMTRSDGEAFAWEVAEAPVDQRLAGLVRRLIGYREWSPAPLRRIEPPYSGVPVIIGFREPLRISGATYDRCRVDGFVAGLDVAAAVTEGRGEMAGVQLDLTPIGATRILGLPLSEIAFDLVRLEDVIGPAALELRERLGAANSWENRLTLVNDFALSRAAAHVGPPPLVEAVWRQFMRSAGRANVQALADDHGVSRKHLTRQFTHWTGLAPSAYARVLRFDRAVASIRRQPEAVDWAGVAARCGYYDQPHFNRDFMRP